MSNDIFSSDYKLEGTDKESFLVNWKNFRSKTKIIKDFDLSKMKIYHINKNISDKLRLLSMDNFINSLEALTFDGNSELKSDNSYYSISANIPDEIKKRIADGNITTAVSVGNKILFLDENCRSMIATKCKASFRKLYEHTIASDILLQLACKEFIPAGKLKTKYPVAIVRADKGVAVLTAFFSESTAVTNLAEIDEMNSPLLKFVNYSISNYATELIFEAEALDEFVPIIKVRFSDTGDGLLKKFLCVRTKTTKRSVIIKELDNETVEEALSFFNRNLKMSQSIVFDPCKILNKDVRFRRIGKKRLKDVSVMFSGLGCGVLTEKDFLLKAMEIPDKLGDINPLTNKYLEESIGNLFTTMTA